VTLAPLTRLGVTHSGVTRTGDTADGYRVMSARRLAHAHSPLSFLEIALAIAVLGVAVAVAVPEFLHLRQDANDDAAKSRLVQAERNVAAGAAVPAGVTVHAAGKSYCLETTAGSHEWHAAPHARPAPGACPAK
jgi:hypothetical protein